MKQNKKLTTKIECGKTYSVGTRWRTPVLFDLGLFRISASVFEDERGAAFFWPAQRIGRGNHGYRKLCGCTDLETHKQVEVEILAAFRPWRQEHPLPAKPLARAKTLPGQITMAEFVEQMLCGIHFEHIVSQLTKRNHARAVRVVNLVYEGNLEKIYLLPQRDVPVFIAIAGQYFINVLIPETQKLRSELR